jgi:CheY-like chemotaxis protein
MARRNTETLNSLLLVDDDDDALELYSHLIQERKKIHLVSTKYPSAALKMAQNHFFDMILIDVTMNYNGTPFGGLELYKILRGRYGDSSLMVYSQFITDNLLKQYAYDFNFVERGTNPVRFVEKTLEILTSLRKRQSCFIAMPFNKNYNQIFRVIKMCVERVNYRCIRVDQQQFTKSIIEKIFTEIDNSKLVVFLAVDQNPNAFYECGYAVALNKEIITITDVFTNLPFDIRDRNAIAFGDNLKKLETQLTKKLIHLTRVSLR